MMRNLGNVERAIRVVLGIVLISAGYMADLSQGAAIAAYAAGAVALGTAAMGFCPAWKLFGINTCQTKTSGS
ncbi:MAG: YgaP family membrane protein [Nitrospiraceae bacterium]